MNPQTLATIILVLIIILAEGKMYANRHNLLHRRKGKTVSLIGKNLKR